MHMLFIFREQPGLQCFDVHRCCFFLGSLVYIKSTIHMPVVLTTEFFSTMTLGHLYHLFEFQLGSPVFSHWTPMFIDPCHFHAIAIPFPCHATLIVAQHLQRPGTPGTAAEVRWKKSRIRRSRGARMRELPHSCGQRWLQLVSCWKPTVESKNDQYYLWK